MSLLITLCIECLVVYLFIYCGENVYYFTFFLSVLDYYLVTIFFQFAENEHLKAELERQMRELEKYVSVPVHFVFDRCSYAYFICVIL